MPKHSEGAKVVSLPIADPAVAVDDLSLQSSLDAGILAAERDLLQQAPVQPTRKTLQKLACALYDARRVRERVFDQDILGEPGWDILLALYGLPSRGEILGISSLAHCAGVPATTGLRWEALLRSKGLIERGPHVSDRRVQLVRLSDEGKALMDRYLTRLYFLGVGASDTNCPAAAIARSA